MRKRIYIQIAGVPILLEGESAIDQLLGMKELYPFLLAKAEKPTSLKIVFDSKVVWPGNESLVKEDALHEEQFYYKCHFLQNTCFFLACDSSVSVVMEHVLGSSSATVSLVNSTTLLRHVLWNAISLLLCTKKMIFIHASCVVHEKKGILFLGESGVGKSTHSKFWLETVPGTSLLNDDSPALFVSDAGCVTVNGSPWSGKTSCYRNESVEVCAIIRLEQADSNQIEKLTPLDSFFALYPSFAPILRMNKVLSDQVNETLASIVKKVPVFKLRCLPDKEAALLVYQTLLKSNYFIKN